MKSTGGRRRCATKGFGVVPSAFLLLAGFPLSAQLLRPEGPLPSFEVATVKPWQPTAVVASPQKVAKEAPVGAAAPVGDRIHFIGQIELLIEAAYGLPFSSGNRLVGGPDWIRNESDRYEVVGKIDDLQYGSIRQMSAAQQREQVSLMELSLLADRFRFRAHIETREMPVYELRVAKGGSKLQPAQNEEKSQLSFIRDEGGYELTRPEAGPGKRTGKSCRDRSHRTAFRELNTRRRLGLAGKRRVAIVKSNGSL